MTSVLFGGMLLLAALLVASTAGLVVIPQLLWRDIERRNERVSWPLYSPTRNGLVSQLGRLTGLTGITTARRLEVTPYVVTKNVQRIRPNAAFARDQQATIGGDLKFGMTPNITLDATVNPDFGQIEADPAVLNLTAFETFLPERRPFFG